MRRAPCPRLTGVCRLRTDSPGVWLAFRWERFARPILRSWGTRLTAPRRRSHNQTRLRGGFVVSAGSHLPVQLVEVRPHATCNSLRWRRAHVRNVRGPRRNGSALAIAATFDLSELECLYLAALASSLDAPKAPQDPDGHHGNPCPTSRSCKGTSGPDARNGEVRQAEQDSN